MPTLGRPGHVEAEHRHPACKSSGSATDIKYRTSTVFLDDVDVVVEITTVAINSVIDASQSGVGKLRVRHPGHFISSLLRATLMELVIG